MKKTIFYSSTPRNHLSLLDIQYLFGQTKGNNDKLNIYGVLILFNKKFYQILEGEAEVIDNLYEKIKKDPRHSKLIEILNQEIKEFSFENYGLAFNIFDNTESLYCLQDYITKTNFSDQSKKTLFNNIIHTLLVEA